MMSSTFDIKDIYGCVCFAPEPTYTHLRADFSWAQFTTHTWNNIAVKLQEAICTLEKITCGFNKNWLESSKKFLYFQTHVIRRAF